MLDASALQASLTALFSPPYAKAGAEAADKLANAYHAYAVAGQVGGVPRALTGTETAALSGPIAAALSVVPNVPTAFTAALTTGLAAYWLGATFAPAGSAIPPGLVGLPALQTTLDLLFAKPNPDPASMAQQLATALHTATLTLAVVSPTGSPVSIV